MVKTYFEEVDENDGDFLFNSPEDTYRKVVEGREKAIELGNKWFGDYHGKHTTIEIKSVPDNYKELNGWQVEDSIDPAYKVVLEVCRWDTEKGKSVVETVYVDEDEICEDEDGEYIEEMTLPLPNPKVFHMSPKTMFKKCLGKGKAEQYFTEDTILVATIYGSFDGHEPIEIDSYAMKGDSKRKYLKGYRKDFIS